MADDICWHDAFAQAAIMNETVIYPQQSLYLVDRGLVRNAKPGIITRAGPKVTIPHGTATKHVCRSISHSDAPARGKHIIKDKNYKVRFVRPNVAIARETTCLLAATDAVPPDNKYGHRNHKTTDDQAAAAVLQRTRSVRNDKASFNLVPGSTNTLYGRLTAGMKPEAADLLHYYSVKIGRSFYPLHETAMPFEFNPVGTVWLPLAITDQVLLNAILLSAAVRAITNTETDSASQYFVTALQSVNEKIAKGTTNDATIAAVSCLVAIEHSLGNQEKSDIHRHGMYKMIDESGGVGKIDGRLLMKIYRAELHLSVDRLLHPVLPRLRRRVPSLRLPGSATPLKSYEEPWKLSLGLHPALSDAMSRLCELSQVLQYSADHSYPIKPRAFDEDIICVQHDLLCSLESTFPAASRACALAGLVYTKTLTRETPFEGSHSLIIAEALKGSYCVANFEGIANNIVLWIHVMAAFAATNTKDSAWFREKVRVSRGAMGVRTWSAAESHLEDIAWIRQVHSQYGQDLWAQMIVEG